MGVTWATARTKVRGDLWRQGSSGVPDEVCDRALHASILELEQARRFLWLENVSRPVTLTAPAATIPSPSDLRSIASISYVRPDGKLQDPLERVTLERARISAAWVFSVGLPTAYAWDGSTISLDAKADTGSTLDIIGIFSTPEDVDAAVAIGDANVTLSLHQAAVIAGACAEIAQTYLKNDQEFLRQRAAFERRLERICDREDEARGDNRGISVVPDTAYQDMAGC